MLKKIIIFSTIIFVIGFTSCSMWDDVDKNAVFEIPVADINVISNGAPNTSQWNGIPVFSKNDKSQNSISYQSINQIQLATNQDKTKLYFGVELNALITAPSYYVLIFSNDYNCDGYFIMINAYTSAVALKYTICGSPLFFSAENYLISNGNGNYFYELSINIPAELPTLKNEFLVTIFATNTMMYPSQPASYTGSSTKARWAKLR